MKDEKLYTLFFKRESDYYLERLNIMEESDKRAFFNPYIFVFGMFWFLYRKLYVEAFVIILIALLLSITFGDIVGGILSLILTILTWFYGNFLYILKAQRVVAKSKANITGGMENYLRKKGGVNWLLPSVLGALIITYFLLEIYHPIWWLDLKYDIECFFNFDFY